MADFASIQPLRRRKLYQEISARLEEMILEGSLGPGDRLPSERDLMERFGVGRPSVRQALFALERMGLVSVASGERAVVVEPSTERIVDDLSGAVRYYFAHKDGLRHFEDVRAFIEIGWVRRAALTATDAGIAELRRAVEENEAAVGDPPEFQRTGGAFHHKLAEMSGNPIFTAIQEAFQDWLGPQRMEGHGEDEAARAHRRIFEAIAARNADRAEAEMADHLQERSLIHHEERQAPHGRSSRDDH